MNDVIIGGIISSVIAALIIQSFRFISRAMTKSIRDLEKDINEMRLKIDYMEIKHEALVLALHNYFHNGFYINYKKELDRLSDDYKFVNKPKPGNGEKGHE